MIKDKYIKIQINEYHKLLQDIKVENIVLPKELVYELLIKKSFGILDWLQTTTEASTQTNVTATYHHPYNHWRHQQTWVCSCKG